MNRIAAASVLLISSLGFAQTPKPATLEDLNNQYQLEVVKQQLAAEKLSGLQEFKDYLETQKKQQDLIQQAQKLQAETKPTTPPPPAPPKK